MWLDLKWEKSVRKGSKPVLNTVNIFTFIRLTNPEQTNGAQPFYKRVVLLGLQPVPLNQRIDYSHVPVRDQESGN